MAKPNFFLFLPLLRKGLFSMSLAWEYNGEVLADPGKQTRFPCQNSIESPFYLFNSEKSENPRIYIHIASALLFDCIRNFPFTFLSQNSFLSPRPFCSPTFLHLEQWRGPGLLQRKIWLPVKNYFQIFSLIRSLDSRKYVIKSFCCGVVVVVTPDTE